MASSTRVGLRNRTRNTQSMGQWLLILPSLIAIALAALLMAGILVYRLQYADRIFRGVSVLGWDVSGMTVEEATLYLRDKIRYYQDAQLLFRDGNEVWIASPQDLGADFNARSAALEAYTVGRVGDIRTTFWQQIQIARQGYTVLPRTVFDPGKAQAFVQQLAAKVNVPVQNASVVIQGFTAEVIPSRPGRELEVVPVLLAIQERILNHSEEPIDLPIREIPPAIQDAEALAARDRVNQILSAPITVVLEDQSWTISQETLRQWLMLEPASPGGPALDPRLDPAQVRAWVEPLAAQVYRLPEDPRLDFDPVTRQVTVLQPARNGYVLDINGTVERILAAAQGPERTVPLAVIVERPAVETNEIASLGIRELVSQATTYFKGSPAGRVKNIEISASRFNGVVVPPDGIFSFNRYLGNVTAEEGYEEAYIIARDRTAVGIGGGICQVSTTAFRAAFFGGFPIVERRAHGYRVSWYETNSIPGLDATIYSPLIDFKFRNDTGAYLLIETETDLQAGTLTFYFYGTRPDREVEIEGPIIANVTPPKDPVYEVDESLPPGTVKQIDWANEGSDVTVYRIIKQNGKVIEREAFSSHYEAWADVYLVSPDVEIPSS